MISSPLEWGVRPGDVAGSTLMVTCIILHGIVVFADVIKDSDHSL